MLMYCILRVEEDGEIKAYHAEYGFISLGLSVTPTLFAYRSHAQAMYGIICDESDCQCCIVSYPNGLPT